MPIESDGEKTSINFKSTSIEKRKIIGRRAMRTAADKA